MDADIASALLLEIPNEFDQPAVEHHCIGPFSVKGRRCRNILRDPVDECREWLDLAARPELRPLRVTTAPKNDRMLCRDYIGKACVHCLPPDGKVTIRVGAKAGKGQRLVHDD